MGKDRGTLTRAGVDRGLSPKGIPESPPLRGCHFLSPPVRHKLCVLAFCGVGGNILCCYIAITIFTIWREISCRLRQVERKCLKTPPEY